MMITSRIERSTLWRFVQVSLFVLTVSLLPLGIGCNNESPVQSDSTGPSAQEEAMATDPDEWSEELKVELLGLAPGRTIEDIAGRIRERQAAMGEGETANGAGDGE